MVVLRTSSNSINLTLYELSYGWISQVFFWIFFFLFVSCSVCSVYRWVYNTFNVRRGLYVQTQQRIVFQNSIPSRTALLVCINVSSYDVTVNVIVHILVLFSFFFFFSSFSGWMGGGISTYATDTRNEEMRRVNVSPYDFVKCLKGVLQVLCI